MDSADEIAAELSANDYAPQARRFTRNHAKERLEVAGGTEALRARASSSKGQLERLVASVAAASGAGGGDGGGGDGAPASSAAPNLLNQLPTNLVPKQSREGMFSVFDVRYPENFDVDAKARQFHAAVRQSPAIPRCCRGCGRNTPYTDRGVRAAEEQGR
jgi:hypothetical protein